MIPVPPDRFLAEPIPTMSMRNEFAPGRSRRMAVCRFECLELARLSHANPFPVAVIRRDFGALASAKVATPAMPGSAAMTKRTCPWDRWRTAGCAPPGRLRKTLLIRYGRKCGGSTAGRSGTPALRPIPGLPISWGFRPSNATLGAWNMKCASGPR